LGAQELLQLFQEAAQLNGFSIEQILAAGVSEGIRTPEAKRGNSPELSPLIGLGGSSPTRTSTRRGSQP
jgi:hypothetical protein